MTTFGGVGIEKDVIENVDVFWKLWTEIAAATYVFSWMFLSAAVIAKIDGFFKLG